MTSSIAPPAPRAGRILPFRLGYLMSSAKPLAWVRTVSDGWADDIIAKRNLEAGVPNGYYRPVSGSSHFGSSQFNPHALIVFDKYSFSQSPC